MSHMYICISVTRTYVHESNIYTCRSHMLNMYVSQMLLLNDCFLGLFISNMAHMSHVAHEWVTSHINASYHTWNNHDTSSYTDHVTISWASVVCNMTYLCMHIHESHRISMIHTTHGTMTHGAIQTRSLFRSKLLHDNWVRYDSRETWL